ncbi:MAG TPA: hypothetical protein VFG54_02915 [Prolixibacteraceae bacterium]|nr:hypothetical protein [Prolixibacteraceae bacterium]
MQIKGYRDTAKPGTFRVREVMSIERLVIVARRSRNTIDQGDRIASDGKDINK